MSDPLCVLCRARKSEHTHLPSGALVCIHAYFTPCQHERQAGTVTISSDGSGSTSDMTCQICGDKVSGNYTSSPM